MQNEAVQVATQQPTFTMQWEGDEKPSEPYTLESMLEANKDDHDLCLWLRAAPFGGSRIDGGGAAPMCWVRRIS